jgi:hypothetical protein
LALLLWHLGTKTKGLPSYATKPRRIENLGCPIEERVRKKRRNDFGVL